MGSGMRTGMEIAKGSGKRDMDENDNRNGKRQGNTVIKTEMVIGKGMGAGAGLGLGTGIGKVKARA